MTPGRAARALLAVVLGLFVTSLPAGAAPETDPFAQVRIVPAPAGPSGAAPGGVAAGSGGDPRAAQIQARLRQSVAAMAAAPAGGQAGKARPPDELTRAISDLKRRLGPAVEVQTRRPAGTPRLIRAAALERGTGAVASAAGDEQTARAFLRKNRGVLRLDDPDRELVLDRRDTDDLGRRHLRFSQTHLGLPVWPADLIVHIDPRGNVDVVNGAFIPTPRRVPAVPVVDADQATASARGHVPDGEAATAGAPTLIVYGPGHRPARLAWKLELAASAASHWVVVVDALTGGVLTAFNDVHDAGVPGSGVDLFGVGRALNVFPQGGQFFMVDTSKPMFDQTSTPPNVNNTRGGIFVLDAAHSQTTASILTSTSANGGFLADGVSAAFNLAQTYDYYLARHNRNSIDGAGGTILGVVRFDQNLANAFWNNEQRTMFFGDADRYAGSTDVVGHEMTHGVTFFTAKLVYQDQAGALNEAFSDIFGEMVEARASANGTNDWLIGTQLARPLRNLANPGALSVLGRPYPSRMSEFRVMTEDNGGVHINSTIIGHAYFLLVEGLPGGGIGRTDAERIFYRALTTHLVANSQFIDARLACVQSAVELFGAGSPQAAKTAQAFDAVEIFDGEGTPDPPTKGHATGPDATIFTFFDAGVGAFFLGRREAALGDGPDGTILTQFGVAPTRASVARHPQIGGLVAYVDDLDDICLIATDGRSPETCLGFQGTAFSVAVNRDGSQFAFVLRDQGGHPTNSISVIDLRPGGVDRDFVLRAPVLDGTTIDAILQADSMTFTSTSTEIVYDALNVLRLTDGTRVGAWSIYSIDILTGTIHTVAPPVPGLDIGFPALGQTSDTTVAFEAANSANGQSVVFAGNLNTGDVVRVSPPSGVFSAPFYTGDDTGIIYSQGDGTPTGSSLVRQAIGPDRLTPTGAPTPWLFDANFGVIYRAGSVLVSDFVTGFYNDVLGRTPAPSEVVAWTDFLLANPTPAAASAMAHGFLDGPEFLSKPRTHAQFVTILYRVFLEREPDGPGLAGWVGSLLDGFDSALPGFVNSQEFRSLLPSFQDRSRVDAVVQRLYVQVLGRAPSPSELSAWTDYIVATGDLLGVARGFFRSDEFNSRPRTLAQHVVILYRTFLGRDPSAAEIGPWVDYHESFRINVENFFIGSAEFQNHFASLFR
jgi:Zn-dependent metalloprotease